MPTRLYFSGTSNTSGITPSFDLGWNYTSEAVRRDFLIAKSASESLAIGTRIGPWSGLQGDAALDRQYISPQLSAQTISGTIKGQVMVREFANTDNVTGLMIKVKVINSAGTETANLFTLQIATGINNVEFINNATCRNKGLASGQALVSGGSWDCALNDRIVVEVGYTCAISSGTTPEAQAKWGAPSSGTDLPENETQTTDGVPWFEFSDDLIWKPPPPTINNYLHFDVPNGISVTEKIR